MVSNYGVSSDFATRMSEIIQDLGLTQAAAARLAGINKSLVHRYCDGSDYPRPTTLDKLTASLHLPAFVFFMSREQAKPFIEEAKAALKKSSPLPPE